MMWSYMSLIFSIEFKELFENGFVTEWFWTWDFLFATVAYWKYFGRGYVGKKDLCVVLSRIGLFVKCSPNIGNDSSVGTQVIDLYKIYFNKNVILLIDFYMHISKVKRSEF